MFFCYYIWILMRIIVTMGQPKCVTSIIADANYNELVSSGIIMPYNFTTEQLYPASNYSTYVKSKKLYAKLGVFVELLVHRNLRRRNDMITSTPFLQQCSSDCSKYMDDSIPAFKIQQEIWNLTQLHNKRNHVGITKNVVSRKFIDNLDKLSLFGKRIYFDYYVHTKDNYSGYVDLMYDDVVLDIKTSKYDAVNASNYLQLLCYAALLKRNGRYIKKIKLFNPLQGTLHTMVIDFDTALLYDWICQTHAHPVLIPLPNDAWQNDYGKYSLTDAFIDKHHAKLDWNIVSKTQSLSQYVMTKYEKHIVWNALSHDALMQCPIRDWNKFMKYRHVNLIKLVINTPIPESILDAYRSILDWKSVSRYQVLSERFIEANKYRVYWTEIYKYQKISGEFMQKYLDRLP